MSQENEQNGEMKMQDNAKLPWEKENSRGNYAFSSNEAFFSSSDASATASFSCANSASAEGAPFTWAGFFAASVARPLAWGMFASSSSRRVISSLAFLMFYR